MGAHKFPGILDSNLILLAILLVHIKGYEVYGKYG
jgi:hypothetical protein